MQHAVRLDRDRWARFNIRYRRSLPRRPSDHRSINPSAPDVGFHLRYDGAMGVTLPDEAQLFAVNFVGSSNGAPALTGHFLVDTQHRTDVLSVETHFVASGPRVSPLVGGTGLEPDRLLGVARDSLMCVPLDAVQHDGRVPGPSSDPSAVSQA